MPRRPVDTHPADQRSATDAAAPGRRIDLTTSSEEPVLLEATEPPATDDTSDDGFVPL